MKVVSKYQALDQYAWGKAAKAWNLLDEKALSVRLEQMPAGEEEGLHYHRYAQQFFFVLKGTAIFEIEGSLTRLKADQGMQILPNQKHRIMNHSEADLEFILCSQPSAAGDRINM